MQAITLSPDTDLGVVVVIGLIFAVLWIVAFIKLMSTEEDAFPGSYVRLGWVAAFIFVWLLAPLTFILWHKSQAKVNVRTNRSRRKHSVNNLSGVEDET